MALDQQARVAKPLANDPITGKPQDIRLTREAPKFECGGGCAVYMSSLEEVPIEEVIRALRVDPRLAPNFVSWRTLPAEPARQRLDELVNRAAHVPKARRPTRPSRAAKKRRCGCSSATGEPARVTRIVASSAMYPPSPFFNGTTIS